jgi:hypothetical protein
MLLLSGSFAVPTGLRQRDTFLLIVININVSLNSCQSKLKAFGRRGTLPDQEEALTLRRIEERAARAPSVRPGAA